MNDDCPAKTIFQSVQLSALKEWLERLSLDDEESELKLKIKYLEEEVEKRHLEYLKSIESFKSDIKIIENKIDAIKKSPKLSEKAERINKIIQEAINQDPEIVAENAKNLLIGKDYDPIIDINKLTTLSEEEKEELYQVYIEEFKRLAGIF